MVCAIDHSTNCKTCENYYALYYGLSGCTAVVACGFAESRAPPTVSVILLALGTFHKYSIRKSWNCGRVDVR
jgi:hypothetical protein